jgi:hypothetical protein
MVTVVTKVVVRLVRDRSELRRFVDVPVALYRRDPAFVPPDRRDDTRLLRRLDGGSLLLARQGRNVVGRIAAFIDERVGGCFGWLDWNGEPAVLEALLAAAAEALDEDGCDTMTGPLRRPLHAAPGLLVDGADRPPPFGCAWNPAGRAEQLDAVDGMERCHDITSTSLVLATLPDAHREIPSQERGELGQRGGDRFVRALATADALSNSPRTDDERAALVHSVRTFADPALAVHDDTGAAVAVPDVNELFIRLGGSLGPRGTVAFLRAARARRWRAARVIAAGGSPDAVLQVAYAARAAGYEQLVVDPALVASLGDVTPDRRWRVFRQQRDRPAR